MSAWLRRTLWSAWALSFALALVCIALFIQGVLRDTRAGQPVLRVDFASATGVTEASFRVWGRQTYDLLVSSVNHDPAVVGRRLQAEFDVEVIDPNGRLVLNQSYAPGITGHEVPSNYGDVRLATVELEGSPLSSSKMRVNVRKPDPAFQTGQTHVKLYKRQYDPGMGGLANYAIMIPGIVLLVIALLISISLFRNGSRLPLLLTLSSGCLLVALF